MVNHCTLFWFCSFLRSHPKLLTLPSSLFYHHELVACAESSLVKHFEGSSLLANPHVPFIFHGVRVSLDKFLSWWSNSSSCYYSGISLKQTPSVQRILSILKRYCGFANYLDHATLYKTYIYSLNNLKIIQEIGISQKQNTIGVKDYILLIEMSTL